LLCFLRPVMWSVGMITTFMQRYNEKG
jgi:hypothetical protein